MDDLTKAIKNLSVENNAAAVLDGSIGIIVNSLGSDENKEELVKVIADSDLVSSVKTRLEQKDCSSELVVQLIAEMAKTDVLRQKCSDGNMVALLLNIMSSGSVSEATQACRALGNICFDNDVSRCEVCEQKGVEKLLDLLKSQLNVESESATALRRVACGFLFNLTNTHETLIEKALSLDVLQLLSDYLKKYSDNENLVQMILLAIGSLADSDLGRVKFVEYGFVKTMASLLASDRLNVELQETILELFANMAETDDIKLALASPDVFDTLLRLMKKSGSDDQAALENAVSDLIVLILTGDDSMNLLYDNGKGQVVAEAINWLKSSSEHLQNSGALAIGNMARSDEHCVRLVQSGITNELLSLVERHDVQNGSCVIQHAVFSALRNLAIPAVNKPLMLKCQLLERILPYVESPMSTVSYKLLGTLRMLVDGQESAAVSVGTNGVLINKVAEWCSVEDHQGVKGEANRLVASLVKNSHSTQVMHSIVSSGALKNLIAMSTAEHVLMQNEAVVALTLIVASLSADVVAQPIIDANLLSNVKKIIVEKESPVELLKNCLTLIKHMSTKETLKQCLVDGGFTELTLNLRSHGDQQVKQLANEIVLNQ